MNFKEGTRLVKTWAKENKRKIYIGLGVITGVVIGTMIVNNKPEEDEEYNTFIEQDPPEGFDCGKDLEMHFVDPETKEVLWKELCTESYMNDFKDCGMQYEEVRKLNGLE